MNVDIRVAILQAELRHYQVAHQLGIHENTFYRLLRTEISKEKKEEIMKAINALKGKK